MVSLVTDIIASQGPVDLCMLKLQCCHRHTEGWSWTYLFIATFFDYCFRQKLAMSKSVLVSYDGVRCYKLLQLYYFNHSFHCSIWSAVLLSSWSDP